MAKFRIILPLLFLLSFQIYAQNELREWVDSLKNTGDINLLLVKLDSVYTANPENEEIAVQLGDVYYQLNMLNDAEYFYNRARAINPKGINGILGVAKIYFLKGEIDSSEILLRKALEINENLFLPYSLLGKISLMKNNMQKARYYFNKSLQVDSTNVESLTNLGLIFQSMGKSKLAEKYLKRAVQFNPQDQLALINLGVFYGSIGLNHKAIIELNKAMKLYPSNPKVYLNLGLSYLNNRIYSEARKYFNKALEYDNLNLDAKYYLLLVDFEEKDYEAAIKKAKEISAVKEDYPQLHLILSNIYFLQGKTDLAINEAKKEITFFPNEAEGYYMLGGLFKFKDDTLNYNILINKFRNRFGAELQNLDLNNYPSLINGNNRH